MTAKGENTLTVVDKACNCVTCGSKAKDKEPSVQ